MAIKERPIHKTDRVVKGQLTRPVNVMDKPKGLVKTHKTPTKPIHKG